MSRPALISTDDAGPRAVIQGAIELAKRKGLQVVFADAYPQGNTDFSAILAYGMLKQAREAAGDAWDRGARAVRGSRRRETRPRRGSC